MTTTIAQTNDDIKTTQKDTKNTQKTRKKTFTKIHIYKETVLVGNTVSLVQNRFGLVRFKGKTKFAKGIWYGIELYHLILKTRHNGTICRKRYFNCPRNKGLFVRREQISSIIKFKDVKKTLKKLEKEQMSELKALKFPTTDIVENIPEIKNKKKKNTKKTMAKTTKNNSKSLKNNSKSLKNKKNKIKAKLTLNVSPADVRRKSTGNTDNNTNNNTMKSSVFSDAKPSSPIIISAPSTLAPAHNIRSKSTGSGIYDSSCSSSKASKMQHMKQLLGITENNSMDFLSEKEEEVLFEKQIHASFARYSRLSMMTESLPAAVFEDIQHEDSDSDGGIDDVKISVDSSTVNAFGIKTGRSQSLIEKLMEDEDAGFNIKAEAQLPVIHSEVKVDDDLFGDSEDRPFFKTLNIDELSSIQEYLIRLFYPFSDYVSEWVGRKAVRRGSGTNLVAVLVDGGGKNPHAIKKGLHVKTVNTHTKCGRELLMEYGIQSNQGWCIVAIQGQSIVKKSKKKIQKILDGIDFEVGYDVLFKHVV